MKTRITFKLINNEYVVTVNGCPHKFPTNKEAWEFIFNTRKEVA